MQSSNSDHIINISRGYAIVCLRLANDFFLFLVHKKCDRDVYRHTEENSPSCQMCGAIPSKKVLDKCKFLGVDFD